MAELIPTFDTNLIENNARLFSRITAEANQIAPLLAQKFTARIKSNDRAYHILNLSAGSNPIELMGKELEFSVDWAACGGVDKQTCFWLNINKNGKYYSYICLLPSEFEKVFTQKGMAPKMFRAWKYATGK